MPRLNKSDDILFPVEECSVFVSFADPDGESMVPVPGKKAIVNQRNRHVLGIVSSGYRLVTNREALDMAYECCRTVFPEIKPGEWEVTGTDAPSTAGHCHMDLVHNSAALDFHFVPAAERPEAFGPFIRVANSYNGLRALAFDIGFYRKVCKNGLILPDSIIHFRFNHMRHDIGDRIEFAVSHERLAKLKTSFGKYLGALRDCTVPRPCFEPLACEVLCLRPPELLEPDTPKDDRCFDEWRTLTAHLGCLGDRYANDLGENAYAVLNTVTEFASYPPANRCVHRDRNSFQRLAGAWLNTFSQECGKPDFSITQYLEKASKKRADTAAAPGAVLDGSPS